MLSMSVTKSFLCGVCPARIVLGFRLTTGQRTRHTAVKREMEPYEPHPRPARRRNLPKKHPDALFKCPIVGLSLTKWLKKERLPDENAIGKRAAVSGSIFFETKKRNSMDPYELFVLSVLAGLIFAALIFVLGRKK
jgi:hypothetical protein